MEKGVVFGLIILTLITVVNSKKDDWEKENNGKNWEHLNNKASSKQAEMRAVSSGKYSQDEMKTAKKILKCIRNEDAAKVGKPDPENDEWLIDDMALSKQDVWLLGETYENCRALVPKGNRQKRQATTYYSLWTEVNGVHIVPYTFNDYWMNSTFAGQRAYIIDAINALGAQTAGCVQFKDRENEANYINIVDGLGCSSYIGMVGGGQSLTLRPYFLNQGHCIATGIIQHEFLHALGIYHEQSRSDRDYYVTINWDNIQNGKVSNFNKCTPDCTNHSTTYDYGSVMHYGTHAFSANGNATITTIPPGVSIGQRVGVSTKDVDLIKLMYCPEQVTTSTTTSTTPTTTTTTPTTTTTTPTTTTTTPTTTTTTPTTTTTTPTTTTTTPTTTTTTTTTPTTTTTTTTTTTPTTTTTTPTTTTTTPTTTTTTTPTTTSPNNFCGKKVLESSLGDPSNTGRKQCESECCNKEDGCIGYVIKGKKCYLVSDTEGLEQGSKKKDPVFNCCA